MKIYERFFALTLVLAMSVLLCSCAGTESMPVAEARPAFTAEPSPEIAEPESAVEDIKLMYFTTELSEFTLREGETVCLHVEADGVSNAEFEWKSSDESCLTIERFEDSRDAELTAEKAVKGGVTLTISCGEFEEEFKVYIVAGN